jgi:hypothetical protein
VFAASYAQLGGGFFAATIVLTVLGPAIALLALRPSAGHARVLRLQRARWIGLTLVGRPRSLVPRELR